MSASAALDAVCARHFDLVLLDYQLPDIPGTEILKLVKRFFPSMLVVMITGAGSEEVAIQALRGGARDYLRKPFGMEQLLAHVESLLNLRRGGIERRRNPFVQLPEGEEDPAGGEDQESVERTRAIFRAVRFIDENLDATLTLAEVARVAGMSKFHFCRRFCACTGVHFREFLAKRRVERAKELLAAEGRSITDIFREVGFKDMTHFARVFKRVAGELPSEFRRRSRGETAPPEA